MAILNDFRRWTYLKALSSIVIDLATDLGLLYVKEIVLNRALDQFGG